MNKQGYFLTLLLSLLLLGANAQTIRGTVTDKTTGEKIMGVLVTINGTTQGAVTDLDGRYTISRAPKNSQLTATYIAYTTAQSRPVTVLAGQSATVDFALEPSDIALDEVVVTARRDMEGEGSLRQQRIASSTAIENIGAKEMSVKGISTAADGVKKISGISIADAGQLFVRGLGDRYSITTLNGMPIASPNPDNKLIPLDLFHSSTIKNITVSKVYEVTSFADYSGAHIDIGTRESVGEDFVSISLSVGGTAGSSFADFYGANMNSLWRTSSLPSSIKQMSPGVFSDYIKRKNPFRTSFSVDKSTALPEMGGSLGLGKRWRIGSGALSILGSVAIDHKSHSSLDNYISTLTAQGTLLNKFNYDNYSQELKIASLGSVGYLFDSGSSLNYTIFYARNAISDYKLRSGFDSEDISLVGSNSTMHVYSLLNNQISGSHKISPRFNLSWNGSYSLTESNEPDRRQVMFRRDGESLSLFKLNKQETMRYFGQLQESEATAEVRLKYNFVGESFIHIGGVFKDKQRDYSSTRLYYNLSALNPTIDSPYNTDSYLNYDNIANGTIGITKDSQPKDQYTATSRIYAAFAELDYKLGKRLVINAGVRYENSVQSVVYHNDASMRKVATLGKGDFFPAVNLRLAFDSSNSLRLAASRTVTRPSFVEMAPFLYKESYGSAEVRGNDRLQNGYNYNLDLRYELFFAGSSDMLSVTGYYKYLEAPIERVQESSGGAAVHSFRNATDGMATGIEVELRKGIVRNLQLGFNASYIYTNVVLPENGGVYTDSKRALQGASPYLINADLTYSPRIGREGQMSFAVLYNLQGPRIESVGIYGMNNVIQTPLHTLDFVWRYQIDSHWSVKAQARNLLNSALCYTQKIGTSGRNVEVERYREGVGVQVGASYKF